MFACGSRDETLGWRSFRLLRVAKVARAEWILDNDCLCGRGEVPCDDRLLRHTFWLLLEPVSWPTLRRLVERLERLAQPLKANRYDSRTGVPTVLPAGAETFQAEIAREFLI